MMASLWMNRRMMLEALLALRHNRRVRGRKGGAFQVSYINVVHTSPARRGDREKNIENYRRIEVSP